MNTEPEDARGGRSVAAYLLAALERRGWNPADLARETGVSHATISRNLSGDRKPQPQTLALYADALGLSERHLLELAGYATPRRTRRPEIEALQEAIADTGDELTVEDLELISYIIRRRRGRV